MNAALPSPDLDGGLPKALAEAHGFNAVIHSCGLPPVGPREMIRRVVSAAGGFVGRVAEEDGHSSSLAFVPSDDASERWEAALPCEQLIACSAGSAAGREQARAYARMLAELCAGRRPLEASWSNGTARIDLARGSHSAGGAVQRGDVFYPAEGGASQRALPLAAPAGPVGARIRAVREEGGDGFLLSLAEGGHALLALPSLPGSAFQAEVRLRGGTAEIMAGAQAVGLAALEPEALEGIASARSVTAVSLSRPYRTVPATVLKD